MSRTEARQQALEALYAAETRRLEAPDVVGLSARAARLVEGVWNQRTDLDVSIGQAARGWRVDRMPVVDISLLRLGLYELRHTDMPIGVVVSELVELAKEYSTENSSRFVNGVLAKLVETERPT
ncbi:Transcription termination protein NusB [hydrothermal vent metagenome]|uniref:Transcription termination protein NusB n=1 Tax=hydrothermal vent metagenome TaxID=652676 RepID=A0A3B0ST98_9ZZZZ